MQALGKTGNNFLSVSQGSLEIVLLMDRIYIINHTLGIVFAVAYIFNLLIKFIPWYVPCQSCRLI